MNEKRRIYEALWTKYEQMNSSYPQKAVENKMLISFSTENVNSLWITEGEGNRGKYIVSLNKKVKNLS